MKVLNLYTTKMLTLTQDNCIQIILYFAILDYCTILSCIQHILFNASFYPHSWGMLDLQVLCNISYKLLTLIFIMVLLNQYMIIHNYSNSS